MYPRLARMLNSGASPRALDRITLTEPLDYSTFLALAVEAALLISDSGGIQEEASVLKKPLIVVRKSTERPEIIGTFGRLIAPGPGIGAAARASLDRTSEIHRALERIESPYGEGEASAKIARLLLGER